MTSKILLFALQEQNGIEKHEPSQFTVHIGVIELLTIEADTNIIINKIPCPQYVCDLGDKIYNPTSENLEHGK